MGTFVAAADRTAIVAAARAVGVNDDRAAEAFLTFPAVAWDAGVAPAVPANMQYAFRKAFNGVGLYDELADQAYAKIATGVKAVATIPNVVGQQEVLAGGNLRAAGLRVGTITRSVNAAAVGQVLSQTPTAGASEVGTPVNLTISLGP